MTWGLVRLMKCILPESWHVLLVQLGFVPRPVWFFMEAFHDAFTISLVNALELLWQYVQFALPPVT